MEVAKIVIRDASKKLIRREIGERLCMILCSFVSSDRQMRSTSSSSIKCGPVPGAIATDTDSRSMEIRRYASWRLRSFPLTHAAWAEELGLMLLFSVRLKLCGP